MIEVKIFSFFVLLFMELKLVHLEKIQPEFDIDQSGGITTLEYHAVLIL
jgi:hypothetical protein